MFADGIYPFNLAKLPYSHSHRGPMDRWAGHAGFVHIHRHTETQRHRDTHRVIWVARVRNKVL